MKGRAEDDIFLRAVIFSCFLSTIFTFLLYGGGDTYNTGDAKCTQRSSVNNGEKKKKEKKYLGGINIIFCLLFSHPC